MAFQNDKNELFEQMGVFKVISGLPKFKKFNSMESINSKSKNLLPYLLDVLAAIPAQLPEKPKLEKPEFPNAPNINPKFSVPSSTKNKDGNSANRILMEILTEFLPTLIKIIKEGVIQGIKAGLACGTDFTIPNPTPELTTTIDKIDLTDMMKLDPNGPAGALFGDSTKDFNRFFLDIITVGSAGNTSSQTWVDRNGDGLIQATYNQPTSSTNNQPTITLKVADGVVNSDGFNRGGTSFHNFLVDYINSVELFSIKNVMGTMMDAMTGLISSVNGIGVDILISQNKMDEGIKKILDIDVCADKVVIDNSFYDFGDEELSFMERNANNKSRGVSVMDLGCGLVEVAVPLSILDNVGDLDTATPSQTKVILEEILITAGQSVAGVVEAPNGETVPNINAPTMKLNFDTSQILNFPSILMRMVITPKIVGLYQISHQTINDNVLNVSDGYDFSKAARTFFEYVTREALAALLEIVFNRIKKELIALISRVVIKIIKEKITIFIGTITGIYLAKAEAAKSKALEKREAISLPDTSNLI